jgi:hypothetical protein
VLAWEIVSWVSDGSCRSLIPAQWIEIALSRPHPQHVKDDLGVLGIVFVPTVVQCLARPGERD